MIEQHRVKKHFMDLAFSVHKLGIEIHENGHLESCKIEKIKREKIIKKLDFNHQN